MFEERYICFAEAACGCTGAFDTWYWRTKPLSHCDQHLDMMLGISLGSLPLEILFQDGGS